MFHVNVLLGLNCSSHLIFLTRCVLRTYNYALASFVLENVGM